RAAYRGATATDACRACGSLARASAAWFDAGVAICDAARVWTCSHAGHVWTPKEASMWYLVLSRRLRPAEELLEHRAEHGEWLDEQHRAGRFLFSGPSTDGMHGIYVLLAENL